MKLNFTKDEINFLAESIKYDLLLSNLHILENKKMLTLMKYDNLLLVKKYLREAANDKDIPDQEKIKEIKKEFVGLGSQLKTAGSAVGEQLSYMLQANTVRSAMVAGSQYLSAILAASRVSLINYAVKIGISASVAGAVHTIAAAIISLIVTSIIAMVATSLFKIAWNIGKAILRGIVNLVKSFINKFKSKKPEEAKKEVKDAMKRSKVALGASKKLIKMVPGKRGNDLLLRINKLDERLSR